MFSANPMSSLCWQISMPVLTTQPPQTTQAVSITVPSRIFPLWNSLPAHLRIATVTAMGSVPLELEYCQPSDLWCILSTGISRRLQLSVLRDHFLTVREKFRRTITSTTVILGSLKLQAICETSHSLGRIWTSPMYKPIRLSKRARSPRSFLLRPV